MLSMVLGYQLGCGGGGGGECQYLMSSLCSCTDVSFNRSTTIGLSFFDPAVF